MPDSAHDAAAADDLSAQRNEQVAQGHEWAANADDSGSSEVHSDTAIQRRRTAGKDRADAEATRNEADKQAD
jgi:hypothetical protein